MGNKREPFEPGCFYHVYNHGNGSDDIFRCDENYEYFLEKYAEHMKSVAETYAWCLMPNHFHLAVRIKDEEELLEVFRSPKVQTRKVSKSLAGLDGPSGLPKLVSRKFGNFLNAYVKAFNKMHDRRGSLFLDNLKRKKVADEAYVTQLVLYIHNNHVKHGFVTNMYDWPHSSVLLFTDDYDRQQSQSLKLLERATRRQVIDWFGGKENFDQAHKDAINMESVFE